MKRLPYLIAKGLAAVSHAQECFYPRPRGYTTPAMQTRGMKMYSVIYTQA